MECNFCGDEFERIGQHWGYNPEHQPNISDFHHKVLTGLLMGDGSVKRDSGRKPYIRVRSITKEYLEFLDDLFGTMGLGVELRYTAEKKASENRDSGFSPDADGSTYSDQYLWKTRRSNQFDKYADWYNGGDKTWPSNIELTPVILRHWYACDGHYNNSRSDDYIVIACSNESENKDKIERMFKDVGLEIAYWNESSVTSNPEYGGTRSCKLALDVENTEKFFDYVGEPLPGFEYKWPDRFNRDTTQ
jgi:hypothetical protein